MPISTAEFMRIAKALADPQRCEILERTAAAGELSCAAIVAQFQLSQATISHHLKELAGAGLLERRKNGCFAYFRFRRDVFENYVAELRRRMTGGGSGHEPHSCGGAGDQPSAGALRPPA